MTQFIDTLVGIFQSSGFAQFGQPGGWLYAVMICVGCFLLYLAIVKEFEPLILLPMAFGMILANLPGGGYGKADPCPDAAGRGNGGAAARGRGDPHRLWGDAFVAVSVLGAGAPAALESTHTGALC